MKSKHFFNMKNAYLWLFIFMNSLLAGCAITWDVAPKQTKSFVSQPYNLHILLVLPEEFRNAKWEGVNDPVSTAVIPLGGALISNTKSMARALFQEVSIGTDNVVAANSSIDAVLTPKLISAERTHPTTIFGQQTSTIILEWTLTDQKAQIIWVNTVKGQGQTAMGLNPKNGAEKQLKIVFDQLFDASYKSIVSSVEIKQFVEKN